MQHGGLCLSFSSKGSSEFASSNIFNHVALAFWIAVGVAYAKAPMRYLSAWSDTQFFLTFPEKHENVINHLD